MLTNVFFSSSMNLLFAIVASLSFLSVALNGLKHDKVFNRVHLSNESIIVQIVVVKHQ
jgi:hypothetical protein